MSQENEKSQSGENDEVAANTFELQLSNTSLAGVEWSVTPEGLETIKITQSPKAYCSIDVPYKPSFTIECSGCKVITHNPSVLAVYIATGFIQELSRPAEIVICDRV